MKLEENEVKEILKENLDSIFNVFVSLGEENKWHTANPADFNLIKPQVVAFATEEFADKTLKQLANDFYCECDHPFKPNLDYDVRFSFEQSGADVITIKALEPATEINNMGSKWEFELIKKADKWKVNQWSSHTLEGEDLQLTREEAETLLNDEEQTATFVKEYQSAEASGKAYFFTIKSSYGEGVAAMSSRDTHFVYDYGEIESNNQQADDKSKPIEQQKEEVPAPESPVKEEKQEVESIPVMSQKAEYLDKLKGAELNEKAAEIGDNLSDDYQLLSDMHDNQQLWDGLLNEIYGVLKTQLSQTEMGQLKKEQLQWIETRDATAQKVYDESGLGLLSEIFHAETLGRMTKERCYELVNGYMK